MLCTTCSEPLKSIAYDFHMPKLLLLFLFCQNNTGTVEEYFLLTKPKHSGPDDVGWEEAEGAAKEGDGVGVVHHHLGGCEEGAVEEAQHGAIGHGRGGGGC